MTSQQSNDPRDDTNRVEPSEQSGDSFATRTVDADETAIGTVIDAYRLLQLIGQGGMGEVWLADQTQPVRRRVAVKLIKAGMDTREVVARFESERQALALMDHPSIAKVFDAGSTAQGRPYFVMEYVNGLSVTEYCDRHKLAIRERLELFMQVCEAIQHAHQKAIIHRDLKPSNILVSEVNGRPLPRIIDFGIAKATSQHLGAQTLFTHLGAVVGTPGYMSPEQADFTGVDVDTRSDVYSLGVVLYELLVGALPLDFREVALNEIVRRLREEDAPRPSTKVRTLGNTSTVTAQNRGLDPPALARQMRGDLDAITLKALEKDRSRRYPSASEFAADVGRYLRHEPILARPPSVGYRAGKYVRRHRIGVAITALVSLLLVVFAITQFSQVQRFRRERDRANRITDFMAGMFRMSNPASSRGNNITAREILDSASREVDTGLARDPELQAQMMDIMGVVYENLGLYPKSQVLLDRAVGVRTRVLGPTARETLQSKQHLAQTLSSESRLTEAERLLRETLATQERVLGTEHADTLKSLDLLGVTLKSAGRYAEAEKLTREASETQRRVLGSEHPDTLLSTLHVAGVLYEEGRFAEAETLERQTLEIQRRVLGSDHPSTLASVGNLALTLMRAGRYDEAEQLQREVLEVNRRIVGPDHPDTANAINSLSATEIHQGRYAEAERLLRELADSRTRVAGSENPLTLNVVHNLSAVISKQGRYDEAEKMELKTRDIRRRVLGPEHPDTASSTYTIACYAALQGRRNEAIALLSEAIDHGLYPWADLAIEKDPDLDSLHGDPRFVALVAHAKERAAAVQNSKR